MLSCFTSFSLGTISGACRDLDGRARLSPTLKLVTQYGVGADIFRVHDGKLTDHWDASPPADRKLEAHDQAFSDRMQKQIDTGVRQPVAGLPTDGPPPASR